MMTPDGSDNLNFKLFMQSRLNNMLFTTTGNAMKITDMLVHHADTDLSRNDLPIFFFLSKSRTFWVIMVPFDLISMALGTLQQGSPQIEHAKNRKPSYLIETIILM